MPSPVSSVLLRVANSDLPKLRDYFLAQDGGITLVQFLLIFVKFMGIQSITDLYQTVPELLFFFDLVDINGDGAMEFSEFVMFVIDEVAEQRIAAVTEKLKLVTKRHIQNAANAVYIRCCRRIPELKAIVVGTGSDFHIYLEDPDSPTHLKLACRYQLRPRSYAKGSSNPRTSSSDGTSSGSLTITKAPEVVDIMYIPSRDCFFVLRSDMCIEYVKIQSRSNIHQVITLSNHPFLSPSHIAL